MKNLNFIITIKTYYNKIKIYRSILQRDILVMNLYFYYLYLCNKNYWYKLFVLYDRYEI